MKNTMHPIRNGIAVPLFHSIRKVWKTMSHSNNFLADIMLKARLEISGNIAEKLSKKDQKTNKNL